MNTFRHSSEFLIVSATIGVLAFASSGCRKKSSTSPSQSETRTISQFFSAATAVGETPTTGTVQTGSAPAAGTGPAVTATSVAQTAAAGLSLIAIQASAPFQTVYISIGSAQTAQSARPDTSTAWAALFFDGLQTRLHAATIDTSGYLKIDLPTPVTSSSVIVNFTSALPASFDVKVQVAAAGGPAGPAATLPKTLQSGAGLIELVGVVYGNFGPNPDNPLGPGLYSPLLAGAVVSTSLDGKTATTNGNGAFDLLTDTPNAIGRCFRLTITATGYPTYSTEGWVGSNKETGGVRFTLKPPQPPDLKSCS